MIENLRACMKPSLYSVEVDGGHCATDALTQQRSAGIYMAIRVFYEVTGAAGYDTGSGTTTRTCPF